MMRHCRSSYECLGTFEKAILKQSFRENYKQDLMYYCTNYLSVIEDKDSWKEIAIRCERTINDFNHTYSKMVRYIKEVGLTIQRIQNYNHLHMYYSLRLLIEHIQYVIDTMEDILTPMDFYMQRVASDRRKDDNRLRNINKMMKIIKFRILEMDEMTSYNYWTDLLLNNWNST